VTEQPDTTEHMTGHPVTAGHMTEHVTGQPDTTKHMTGRPVTAKHMTEHVTEHLETAEHMTEYTLHYIRIQRNTLARVFCMRTQPNT
jgi:hypothetical protein